MKNLLTFICLLVYINSIGQTRQIGAATTMQYLLFPIGSSGPGMGNTGVAIGDDISPVYNVAKMPFIEFKSALTASYTPWFNTALKDAHYSNLQYNTKLSDKDYIGLNLGYYTLGNVFFKDIDGNEIAQIRPREVNFQFSYVKLLGNADVATNENIAEKNAAVGVTVKSLYSDLIGGNSINTIQSNSVLTPALDFSYFKRLKSKNENKGYALGITVSNLGPKISYFRIEGKKNYLPTNLKIGFGYTVKKDEENYLSFGIDVSKLLTPTPPEVDTAGVVLRGKEYDRPLIGSIFSSFTDAPNGISEEFSEMNLHAGFEYTLKDKIMLRTGISLGNSKNINNAYSLGVGYRAHYYENVFNINFAYIIPFNTINTIGNNYQISFKFKLQNN